MTKENSRRGRRNRQRGAELQREVTRMARFCELDAHNRDRGGAQHEKGDVEIENKYYGCKRRKKIAQWLKPEKQEIGVFVRLKPLGQVDFGKQQDLFEDECEGYCGL